MVNARQHRSRAVLAVGADRARRVGGRWSAVVANAVHGILLVALADVLAYAPGWRERWQRRWRRRPHGRPCTGWLEVAAEVAQAATRTAVHVL